MARRRTRRSKETSTENQNIRPVVEKGMIGGRFKPLTDHDLEQIHQTVLDVLENIGMANPCLLYTSPSPRDRTRSRMPSSA